MRCASLWSAVTNQDINTLHIFIQILEFFFIAFDSVYVIELNNAVDHYRHYERS